MSIAPFLDRCCGEVSVAEATLAALYLPGFPGRPHDPPKRMWRAALGVTLRSACSLGAAPKELRAAGLWAEALALEAPGVLSRAEGFVKQGTVVTAASPAYPQRWLNFEMAPPAVYSLGSLSNLVGASFLSIVGSRSVTSGVRAFSAGAGSEASRLGYVVFSGGAAGCDKAGVSRVSSFVELLPRGFDGSEGCDGGCRLSLRPPGEGFSVAAAMERNALIYAASNISVVVHARFKQGGTWNGACEAMRRKFTKVIVRRDPSSMAHRALAALGAIELNAPTQLLEAIEAPMGQLEMF